jgi:hypothetical protein
MTRFTGSPAGRRSHVVKQKLAGPAGDAETRVPGHGGQPQEHRRRERQGIARAECR